MKRIHAVLLWSVSVAGWLASPGAYASAADQVSASQAWIRVLPGELPAGGYVTLKNNGTHAVSLSSASSAVYTHVMLHQSSTAGGMSRMSMVHTLAIPAHGSAVLAPAGYHLMLMQPITPVKPGDIVKLTLRFTDGSTLATDFVARPANAMGSTDQSIK